MNESFWMFRPGAAQGAFTWLENALSPTSEPNRVRVYRTSKALHGRCGGISQGWRRCFPHWDPGESSVLRSRFGE